MKPIGKAHINGRAAEKGETLSIRIELIINSGLPDPAWHLSSDAEAEFTRRLRALRTRRFLKVRAVATALGYRGMLITAGPRFPWHPPILVYGGLVDPGEGEPTFVDEDDFEGWLMRTGALTLRLSDEYVAATISKAKRRVAEALSRGSWLDQGGPPYEPSKWNSGEPLRGNNCYNYACNIMTCHPATPGGYSMKVANRIICEGVVAAAEGDGLQQSANEKTWKVALVIRPPSNDLAGDYHWYRQDSDGLWSHKLGISQVSRLDDDGNAIVDPEKCARSDYTKFCGYLYVDPRYVHIR